MPLRIPINATSPHDATSLITHLSKATLTVCICAYIKSALDNTELGITSHSSDITGLTGYPGVTFKSNTGVTGSKVEHLDGAQPANMEADLFLITAGITEADVLAGKWAHAQCIIFAMNYEAPTMGQLILNKGFLSEFVERGQLLTAEIRGFNQALKQQIGRVTRPECDADFGDTRCGLDLAALGFVKTGSITAVTSQTVFRDSARTETDDYFQNGVFTFTSGNNNNYSFHIDKWDATNKEFTLRTPAPYLPVVGNTYSAKRGCRKRALEDCTTKFSNRVNFRGWEWIPTLEELNRLPLS